MYFIFVCECIISGEKTNIKTPQIKGLGKGSRNWMLNGYGVSIWSDEKALELDS